MNKPENPKLGSSGDVEIKGLQTSLNLSEPDIAWIAGLLEGEGSFGIDRRSATRYVNSTAPGSPTIQLTSTDRDVIIKFANMLGKKHFSPQLKPGHKQTYKTSFGDRATANYVLPRILPYMSILWSAAIQEIIDEIEAWKVFRRGGGLSAQARFGGLAKKEKESKVEQ